MKCRGLLICIPCSNQIMQMQTAQSIFCVAQMLTKRGIPNRLLLLSAADIEDIRNMFLTVWYDAHPQFSHMLFVDADMGFEANLIEDMIYFDKPLMGVLYARRNQNVSIVGTLPEGHSMKDVQKGFMRSNGLGTGVMMIAREVVDTLLEKMPELSDPNPSLLGDATDHKLKRIIRAFDKIKQPDLRLSEDMSFCYRHLQCGGEIWANVNYRISHIGPFDFGLRYQGIMERKEQAKDAA